MGKIREYDSFSGLLSDLELGGIFLTQLDWLEWATLIVSSALRGILEYLRCVHETDRQKMRTRALTNISGVASGL